MPIGAHRLLSFLAEPLKQLQELSDTLENYNVSENLREFQDWVCISLSRPFVNQSFSILISVLLPNRVNIIPVMQHIAIGSKLN